MFAFRFQHLLCKQLRVRVHVSSSNLQRCATRGREWDTTNAQFQQSPGLIRHCAKIWFLLMPAKILLSGFVLYCLVNED